MNGYQLHNNILMFNVFFLAAGWLFCRLMVKGVLNMITSAGFVRPNYRGDDIPAGAGLVIYLSVLAVYTAAFIFLPEELQRREMVLLLAVSSFTLLGLVDDVWGSRDVSGLKGHFLSLFKGRLTTGGLKAVAGGVVALLVAATGENLAMIPVDAVIIALSVNSINLLDLRPGRAGKAFLLLWLMFYLFAPQRQETALLAAVAGGLLGYMPYDLKARSMMGDTGANALGAALGAGAVWMLDTPYKIGYLVLLVALHVFAEKYSLTGVIAKNRLLDYLDRLGRG